jgi:hypothetical protein
MKRFLFITFLSCLFVLSLGNLVHSQDTTTIPPLATGPLTQTQIKFIRNKALKEKRLVVIEQGYENWEGGKRNSRLKNDLGVRFASDAMFSDLNEVTMKLIEDSGEVLDKRILKKKEILIKIGENKKTGEIYYGFNILYIELPKGKRVLKGLTVEFTEINYSQHFDAIYEAYPGFVRIDT